MVQTPPALLLTGAAVCTNVCGVVWRPANMSPSVRRPGYSSPDAAWWLMFAIAAFAVGLGLSFCAIQVMETAAKVAL
jgi:hypothetical protein